MGSDVFYVGVDESLECESREVLVVIVDGGLPREFRLPF